jgi:hypothetical protein
LLVQPIRDVVAFPHAGNEHFIFHPEGGGRDALIVILEFLRQIGTDRAVGIERGAGRALRQQHLGRLGHFLRWDRHGVPDAALSQDQGVPDVGVGGAMETIRRIIQQAQGKQARQFLQPGPVHPADLVPVRIGPRRVMPQQGQQLRQPALIQGFQVVPMAVHPRLVVPQQRRQRFHRGRIHVLEIVPMAGCPRLVMPQQRQYLLPLIHFHRLQVVPMAAGPSGGLLQQRHEVGQLDAIHGLDIAPVPGGPGLVLPQQRQQLFQVFDFLDVIPMAADPCLVVPQQRQQVVQLEFIHGLEPGPMVDGPRKVVLRQLQQVLLPVRVPGFKVRPEQRQQLVSHGMAGMRGGCRLPHLRLVQLRCGAASRRRGIVASRQQARHGDHARALQFTGKIGAFQGRHR